VIAEQQTSHVSNATGAVAAGIPLISVCVCTYKRPALLEQLLNKLSQQMTKGLFQFSVLVVDNDAKESARSTVESWEKRTNFSVTYRVEPQQNIAVARNASVALATGELVAFIDDDEEPSEDWLYTLYQALLKYDADGVLGPVLPKFEKGAPTWAVKGQVFQRPGFETGTVIHWSITGTGNVLLWRNVLQELDGPFNPQLGAGGEDTDLFRRAMAQGRKFVWSAEAVCQERVPPERTRISFQLRRALLRGKIAARGHRVGWRGVIKSLIAVPIYAASLPICLVMGSHVFVTYLVRGFDHLGKLLASCGIDLVGERYITS
jgi:succinoglycan biosynthesis protein ExoM